MFVPGADRREDSALVGGFDGVDTNDEEPADASAGPAAPDPVDAGSVDAALRFGGRASSEAVLDGSDGPCGAEPWAYAGVVVAPPSSPGHPLGDARLELEPAAELAASDAALAPSEDASAGPPEAHPVGGPAEAGACVTDVDEAMDGPVPPAETGGVPSGIELL